MTVLVSEQVNCKYTGVQLRAPVTYNLPGKSIKYTAMQIIEATKQIKGGTEYCVSYGSEYKNLYLQGKPDENQDPNTSSSGPASGETEASNATCMKRRRPQHTSTI